MEFKLNRIDTEIRKKINDDRSSDKIHEGKNINVNKELKDKDFEKQVDKDKNKKQKHKQKRYITVDGIKYSKKQINIRAEKDKNLDIENSIGRILDIKK